MKNKILPSNTGRRSMGDRRAFSYAIHVPERRTGKDRRDGFDRRSKFADHAGEWERRRFL